MDAADRRRALPALLAAFVVVVSSLVAAVPASAASGWGACGAVRASYPLVEGFDRLIGETHHAGPGQAFVDKTTVYDPFDRAVLETVTGGGESDRTTRFTYLGLSEQVAAEQQRTQAGVWETTKVFTYAPDGKPLALDATPVSGVERSRFYSTNARGDVEALTDPASGTTTATYRYTAYGTPEASGTLGEDEPTADPTDEVVNPYRFNAKRIDAATGSIDMGFRTYDPGINTFLTRDSYNGALADLRLGLDPWNSNRYAYTGGNPITRIELDGHLAAGGDAIGGGNATRPCRDCERSQIAPAAPIGSWEPGEYEAFLDGLGTREDPRSFTRDASSFLGLLGAGALEGAAALVDTTTYCGVGGIFGCAQYMSGGGPRLGEAVRGFNASRGVDTSSWVYQAGSILGPPIPAGVAAGLAAKAASRVTKLAANGGTDVVRHYTTREAAESITKGGQINPGKSGKIWITPDEYASGAQARSRLSLDKTPDGYFEIPMCRIQCPSAPSKVEPWAGQPGGGIEITTEFPIDIRGLIFRGFE